MTDSTAERQPLAGVLAARVPADADERARRVRRGIAAAAVLLVHVVAIAVFLFSSRLPPVERVKQTVPEAIFVLAPYHPPARVPPKKIETPPPIDTITLPTEPAPITLPPPPRSRSLPLPPSEGLLGVGRSLACGASSYENLSPAQREDCLRHPWHFVKRPDGTIVLEAPAKPPPPPAFTGADVVRHQDQTAPPCPLLNNVPCLSKILPDRDPVTNGTQQ